MVKRRERNLEYSDQRRKDEINANIIKEYGREIEILERLLTEDNTPRVKALIEEQLGKLKSERERLLRTNLQRVCE